MSLSTCSRLRKRSLKTARTRFAISQVQVAFGVYGSVISESYRFQDSRRRYRKTVVLPNRSTFGSANIDRSNLVSNYGRRAHYSPDVFKTNHASRRRFNGITKLAGFVLRRYICRIFFSLCSLNSRFMSSHYSIV